MTSGLYGLFRLDGGPVRPDDAATLGFTLDSQAGAALAKGVDAQSPQSVHESDREGATILVGDIDDAEGLAARLGLSPEVATADLACAALARFGALTPREVYGEWTLLHWAAGRLTLMASAARRDELFYAVAGSHCAVSPDLFRIAHVPWVGRDIDDTGLLFSLGRSALRHHKGSRTIVARVRRVAPGGSVTIDADGINEEVCDVLQPQPRWSGTFEDAIAEAEELLLTVMGERMRRTGTPALLLSGGLDSSLLAWVMAERLGAGQCMQLITSVAPAGSGIPDESRYADMVADALGLSCAHVVPPPDADAYMPSLAMMRGSNGPLLSNRGPLSEAFQATARANNATQLVNGCYGEMHLTGWPSVARAPRTRDALRAWVKRIIRPGALEPEPFDAFHTRLSAARHDTIPADVRIALSAPPPPPYLRKMEDAWGYTPQSASALGHPNEFCPGALRMDFPYRDVRLLRLFATFPMHFFERDGFERAPARQILKGRLPDLIRLRRSGMPASPDHLVRLQQQAPAARARIPAHRAAGLDEWLDLHWLDTALAHIADRGALSIVEANEVQMTAINAEYLTWWRTGTLM